MAALLFPCNRTSSPSPTLTCIFKPISSTPKRTLTYARIPARDRVIDFGKYEGKMLGTLPSKYLTWVSKNLRARDFEDWAKLADEVLEDPVYKDRLEWESAERILSGDDSRASRTQTPVSDLAEIAERFGWDSENEAAWRKVDFALLGTSKGRRIPRIGGSDDESEFQEMAIKGECELGFSKKNRGVPKMGKLDSLEKDLGLRGEKRLGFLQKKSGISEIEEMGSMESKRERKSGSLNGDSGISGIGAVAYSNEELRFRNSRNSLVSLDEKGTFLGKESRNFDAKKLDSFEGRKVGFLSSGSRYYDSKEEDFEQEMVRGKREERRERQRLRRSLQMQGLKSKVGVKEDRSERRDSQKQTQMKGKFNPFPGREALLRKVSKHQD
ncbi:hypothetical protein AAC387_Pa04g2359 [Persea americana]